MTVVQQSYAKLEHPRKTKNRAVYI